ncbi:MAG: hypothetical protein ACI93R_002516 [Flavobacteriales bacterium]|jgi:hypothetical protein
MSFKKNILRFVLLLAFFTPFSLYAVSSSGKDYQATTHVVANLLLSPKNEHRKLAAKMLAAIHKPNEQTLDLIAYRFAKSYDVYTESEIDTVTWYLQALSTSQTDRYSELVSEVATKTKHNKKIQRYIKKFKKRTRKARKSDSFKLSDVNYRVLRNAIRASNLSGYLDVELSSRVFDGDTVNDVYRKLGNPSSVSFTSKKSSVSNSRTDKIKVSAKLLTLNYNGFGNVAFDRFNDKYRVVLDRSTLDARGTSKFGTYYDKLDVIRSSNAHELRLYSGFLYYCQEMGDAYLDAMARRVWGSRSTNDKLVLEAMVNFVDFIARSKNPRYTLFLRHLVKHKTKHKSLNVAATRALSEMPRLKVKVDYFRL